MNRAILIGNVGKDPEIKSFQNGGKIANFSIATSERWKDKQTGEAKEKTEWHNISVNNDGLVGIVERFVKKGSKVAVEGKIQTRKWTDRDGNDRYTTEIVLTGFDGRLHLLSKAEGASSGGQSSGGQSGGWDDSQSGSQSNADDLDDDVPF